MRNLFMFFCLVLTGCYYDKEEELYGASSCDTTNVTYSGTVSGILNSYGCISCHSGATAAAGINLDGAANVKTAGVSGRLMGAINHQSGYSPMPKGGGKMSACDINKIKAWLDAGAVNN